MTSISPLPAVAPGRRRIVGLDIARAFAVLGMFFVHIAGPAVTPGEVGWVDRILDEVNGRAMALFLVLSGCGMTLLFRNSPRPWRQAAGRAAILLALGLLLSGRTIIAVILPVYAVYLFLGAATRRLQDKWLLILAAAIGAAGAVARFHLGRIPQLVQPFDFLAEMLVTGVYPVFPDGALVLFGMWIARQVVAGRSIRRIAMVGLALATLGLGVGWLAAEPRNEAIMRYSTASIVAAGSDPMEEIRLQAEATGLSMTEAMDRLAQDSGVSVARLEAILSGTAEPSSVPNWVWFLTDTSGHSGLPGTTLSVAGLAALVIAACLASARRLRFLAPLGQMSLTAYVAHVLLVWWSASWWPGSLGTTAVMGMTVALWAAFAFAAAWWSPRRGPLEALLRTAGNRAAGRRLQGRGEPDPSKDGSADPSVARCAAAVEHRTM